MSARRMLVVLLLLAAAGAQGFAADRVRIAVLGLFRPQEMVLEVSPASPMFVTAAGKQMVLGVGSAERVSISRSGSLVLAHAAGGHFRARVVEFSARQGTDADFVLAVPGKLRRRYYGKLVVTADARELFPVVEMDAETAVASVVAAELPAGVPMEALKAQAVVARSYLAVGGSRHANADFCDTTHCQFLREPPAADSPAARAARATAGLFLTWQGRPFAALYSASCGGRTRSLAEAGYVATAYPYFAVECAYCRHSPETWTSHLGPGGIAPKGERERVGMGRRLGWNAVPSNSFTQRKTADGIDLIGAGRGHGIGLCQRGAAQMAREGKDFRAILGYYYPNTAIGSNHGD